METEEFHSGGERLTSGRAQARADAALREVRTRNPFREASRSPAVAPISARVQFRVPARIRQEAEDSAQHDGISLSALARRELDYRQRRAS